MYEYHITKFTLPNRLHKHFALLLHGYVYAAYYLVACSLFLLTRDKPCPCPPLTPKEEEEKAGGSGGPLSPTKA